MKLVIMKQKHLDALKASLEDIYTYYYSESTNDWMTDLCGESPFIEFGENIPSFELASLDSDRTAGEIDLENCKIVYENLKFLTESQASDERLWAGLCNGTFYDYMRKRCKYNVKKPLGKEKGAGEIKSRFFFASGTRGGFYRNTLAKCWWVGKLCYEEDKQNHFEKLDILGPNDMSTKVSDIFRNYTFSSNPEILGGIIDMFDYYNKEGIKVSMHDHIRKALQHLNAIGGGLILDCLSREEVCNEMVTFIDAILQGDDSDTLENNDEEDNDDYEDDLTNVDMDNMIDKVSLGSLIEITNVETSEKKRYVVSYMNTEFPQVVSESLDKCVGDIIELNNQKYEITKISLNRK